MTPKQFDRLYAQAERLCQCALWFDEKHKASFISKLIIKLATTGHD